MSKKGSAWDKVFEQLQNPWDWAAASIGGAAEQWLHSSYTEPISAIRFRQVHWVRSGLEGLSSLASGAENFVGVRDIYARY